MKIFNTALIGCGRIGFSLETDKLRNKPCTHWGGAKSAHISVNYACDINKNNLEKFAATNNIPENNQYTNYKKLLKNIRPEFVIIATWTSTHSDIGIYAAKNGAKVIICEKPIAANLKDAKKFINTCKKNNVKLIINHERRFDPRYQAVKKLLDTGKIGKVVSANGFILTSSNIRNSKIEDGGGPLLHDGTHLSDLIGYFFGETKDVFGKIKQNKSKKGFEKHALAWLSTKNNIDIFIEAGGDRKYFMFQLDIYGTNGKITIGNGYQHLYTTHKSKYYTGFKDLHEIKFPNISNTNCFANLYKYAKKLLLNKSTESISSGIDGYKSLEIIHSVYYSSFVNKKIKLPISVKKINLKKIFNL